MSKGLHHRSALILILLPICVEGIGAEEFGGLSPPVQRITILVDTQSEDPPTYNGVTAAPLPQAGTTLELQIFAPDAAGGPAYAYTIQFDNALNAFTDHFAVQSAVSWTSDLLPGPSGRPSEVLTGTPMRIPTGGGSPGVAALYPDRPSVPSIGLIATITLKAVRDVPPDVSLRLKSSIAIYSITPPTRLWHMIATHTVPWS